METIKENKKLKENKYENAFIDDGYIIPGLNGVKVNELDSYYQMVNEKNFFENKLVFYQVKPEISLEDNKNLIIKKGNFNKKSVSIILEYNKNLINYLNSLYLKFNVLVNENNFDKDALYEQISLNEKVDALFKKYNVDNIICFVPNNNLENCIMQEKYLIKPSYEIKDNLIYNLEINSGDIIYIKSISLDNLKYLIRKINYRNLKITYVSELISEFRNMSLSWFFICFLL